MSLLFDVVIVLVLAFFAWRGAVKGLVLTLCGLAAVFVAAFAAQIISDALCAPVAGIIRPVIVQSFEDAVSGVVSNVVSDAISDEISDAISGEISDELSDEMLDAISDAVSGVLSGDTSDDMSGAMADAIANAIAGVTQSEISDEMSNAISNAVSGAMSGVGDFTAGDGKSGYTVGDLLDTLGENELFRRFSDLLKLGMPEGALKQNVLSPVNTLADYLSRGIAKVVLFVIVFIGVQLIWFLVSHALDLAFKLPILAQVNLAGGLVIGLVKGALLVIVLVWLGQVAGLVPAEPETPVLSLFTVKQLGELLTGMRASGVPS